MMRSEQPPWEEVWLVGGSKPRWLWSRPSTGSPPWSSRPQNPWSARWWGWGKYDVVEWQLFFYFKDHGHAEKMIVLPEEENNKNASNDQRDPQEDWKPWGGKKWVGFGESTWMEKKLFRSRILTQEERILRPSRWVDTYTPRSSVRESFSTALVAKM